MIHVERINDSNEDGERCRQLLDLGPELVANLCKQTVDALFAGGYQNRNGQWVNLSTGMANSRQGQRDLAPDAQPGDPLIYCERWTHVRFENNTTLLAAQQMLQQGQRPLVLNLASGKEPGGHFLKGGRAQEETLCRASTLYPHLTGHPMYAFNDTQPKGQFSDWAIYTPAVQVFRTDDGQWLNQPWYIDVLTCAAPVAFQVSEPRAILKQRIFRMLRACQVFGHRDLLLGAWGCGAYKNDPVSTGQDLAQILADHFEGSFDNITFAIADWRAGHSLLHSFATSFRERIKQYSSDWARVD